VTGDTTNLPNIQYCLRAQRTAGSTTTTGVELSQSMESAVCIPYAGKPVTISFYARAGANYSSASNALTMYLYSGTSTDGNLFAGGFTGAVVVASTTATLTTTWQRFTVTGTVGATATQLAPYALYSPTGTAGANDYYEITGVQIDIGSVALPFRTNGATIHGELAACQWFYYALVSVLYTSLGKAVMTTATAAVSSINFPQLMRTTPTINTTGTAGDYRVANASAYTCTAVPAMVDPTFTSPSGCSVLYASTGMTAGGGAYVNTINNASAFLAFSAEL
jgi:hypothetical protein